MIMKKKYFLKALFVVCVIISFASCIGPRQGHGDNQNSGNGGHRNESSNNNGNSDRDR